MRICRFHNPAEVAEAAAEFVAERAREAITERLRFTLALSGGSTPWKMLNRLADADLEWDKIHVFQVDERSAPDGDPARNLTHIREQFTDRVGIDPEQVHGMPVDTGSLEDGALDYARELARVTGHPATLDLVHLGLGGDGHTASLLPDDALLGEFFADVGVTPPYQGHARMSLTYPAIDRARHILWLVNGQDKADMLARMLQGDSSIPAGRVSHARATVFTDIRDAAPAS